ncbi:uncharacterized protein G2W53_042136 [Senna tora]|uniref:Uncharacterized protein n=1 Tax=Senna tora TaxID=362788 RepID=A0A834SI92_9FABA|nr:uncharacterized protein G2W53_042136 [Senna tora]
MSLIKEAEQAENVRLRGLSLLSHRRRQRAGLLSLSLS